MRLPISGFIAVIACLAEQGKKELVKELIAALPEANIDVVNSEYQDLTDIIKENGYSALMLAAAYGLSTAVEVLLDAGASVNVKNGSGYTALMEAARMGHSDIVKLLLERDAEVNERDDMGRTALIGATCFNQPETVKILVEKGADFNVKDLFGNTALDHAWSIGHEKTRPIIEILEKAGAETKAPARLTGK